MGKHNPTVDLYFFNPNTIDAYSDEENFMAKDHVGGFWGLVEGANLTEKQTRAVELVYIYGMNHRLAARECGISRNGFQRNLYGAMKKIKAYVESLGPESTN